MTHTKAQIDSWVAVQPITVLERVLDKIWRHIRKEDGYQPWGYDVPTMRITRPHLLAWILSLQREIANWTPERERLRREETH